MISVEVIAREFHAADPVGICETRPKSALHEYMQDAWNCLRMIMTEFRDDYEEGDIVFAVEHCMFADLPHDIIDDESLQKTREVGIRLYQLLMTERNPEMPS